MKNYILAPFSFLLLLFACAGCENTRNFLDIPLEGNVSGIIYDSLTKKPIAGAIITATFILPNSSSGEEATASFETTNNGSYFLKDLWDEVLIQVKKDGFETVAFSLTIGQEVSKKPFNIALKGLPVVFGEFITHQLLNYEANDTTEVILEIRDIYNENSGGAEAYVFFYEIESDLNVGAVQLESMFQSRTFTTLGTKITADMFPKPPAGKTIDYSYYYEISDPDDNIVDYGLAEEEVLDTIRVFHP